MGSKKKTKKSARKNDKELALVRGAMTYDAVQKRKQMEVLGLIVALVVVLTSSVLFVGAVSGWFDDSKVTLSPESLCEGGCEMANLSGADYENMIEDRKSFVVFVDQTGCKTADKVRGFVTDWAKENGVRIYKIMFSEARETSLHDDVKYYPSVAIVSNGKPVAWLRADEDEDSDAYNNKDAFFEWISKYLPA